MNTIHWRQANPTILILLLLLPHQAIADQIKTTKRKFKMPPIAEKSLSRKIKYEDTFRKWAILAWWSNESGTLFSSGVGNGFELAFMTPEVIAGLTNFEAKSKLLSEDEAQKRYEENLLKFSRDKIAFDGYIQINHRTQGFDAINSDWTFYLYTEDGKRYKPEEVILSRSYIFQYDKLSSALRKDVKLIFNNTDSDTKKSLFTMDTRFFQVAMAGAPGQVKAHFEFEQSKRKK